jgi:hypothetical protein
LVFCHKNFSLASTVVAWYLATFHTKEPTMTDTSSGASSSQEGAHGPHEFRIQIDRVQYTVVEEHMTGAQIRHVPPTPIGPERDLFEVVPGHPDNKVEDNEEIEIKNGKRFFTAPGTINPGAAAPCPRITTAR